MNTKYGQMLTGHRYTGSREQVIDTTDPGCARCDDMRTGFTFCNWLNKIQCSIFTKSTHSNNNTHLVPATHKFLAALSIIPNLFDCDFPTEFTDGRVQGS